MPETMAEEVYSVSEITGDIRARLEAGFSGVWVEGEVSNLRRPSSGHSYFTLKDEFAQLSTVFFRGAASRSPVDLKDGLKVQAFGDISVYEARGQYQLVAQVVQATGAGDLQARFEALKKKLNDEGLFDPDRKNPLPLFPRTIGIVTSPTGAALQDMKNVFARRSPWLRLLVYPARVQGDGAAEEIAAGVRWFAAQSGEKKPDLIIVARGGGSIEDLWCFNDEALARVIADCPLPVISGVGHEIDFTIVDFVADRREPTPSAAAENAAPDGAALHRHLDMLAASLEGRAKAAVDRKRQRVEALRRELEAREPRRVLQGFAQSLDYAGERLEAAVQRGLEKRRQRVAALADLIESLGPEATVRRGFAVVTDSAGRPVTSVTGLQEGVRLRTRVADGEFESEVTGMLASSEDSKR